ncbi:unnamed protein product, partial [Ectocarpus sp. 8 AP-2014]
SRASSPPAFPPPPGAAAAPGATSRVASSGHDVAAKAAQSAAGATGRASSSGHRGGVGAQHASPQDHEASGWDVLMGAVNLELKRSEPAAPNTTVAAAATNTAAVATSASDTAQHRSTVAASVAPSSSPSAMVRGCGASERGPRGAPPPDGSCAGGRTDAYFGNREIVAACRALRTLPHVPVDDAPGSGSAPAAVGAGAVSLPGFSMTKNVAAPTDNAVTVEPSQEPPA